MIGALRTSIVETWRLVCSPRVLAIVVSVMIFAVISGPFGTLQSMGLAERVQFWCPIVAVSVLVGWMCSLIAQIFLRDRHPAVVESASVVMMTAVFAPFVWLMTHIVQPATVISAGGFLKLVAYVFIVAATVGVVRYAAARATEEATEEAGAEVSVDDPGPRLMRRLPKPLRGPILRLSAKDHMVQVVTETGTADLRMRLSDAVAEMEPVEGLMAHRSHWVAKDAVVEACRQDAQKVYLKLRNGDLVPISRTFRPDWIGAGILSPCSNGPSLDAASVPPAAQDRSERPRPPAS